MGRNYGIRQRPELLAEVVRLGKSRKKTGLTLREIGEQVGLSPIGPGRPISAERIRQILKKEDENAPKDADLARVAT